ncbi:MAG: DUF1934 domain-containing protein [Filifactoraceae bacterium]
MEKAIIEIKTTQTSNDTKETDVIELITEGKFYNKNGNTYLVYDETELTGMEGTTTNIKISKDMITMRRFGNVRSVMEFKPGIRHNATYDTLYGRVTTELLTEDVDVQIDYEKTLNLKVNIKYDIAVKGMFAGSNIMEIKAKTQ